MNAELDQQNLQENYDKHIRTVMTNLQNGIDIEDSLILYKRLCEYKNDENLTKLVIQKVRKNLLAEFDPSILDTVLDLITTTECYDALFSVIVTFRMNPSIRNVVERIYEKNPEILFKYHRDLKDVGHLKDIIGKLEPHYSRVLEEVFKEYRR